MAHIYGSAWRASIGDQPSAVSLWMVWSISFFLASFHTEHIQNENVFGFKVAAVKANVDVDMIYNYKKHVCYRQGEANLYWHQSIPFLRGSLDWEASNNLNIEKHYNGLPKKWQQQLYSDWTIPPLRHFHWCLRWQTLLLGFDLLCARFMRSVPGLLFSIPAHNQLNNNWCTAALTALPSNSNGKLHPWHGNGAAPGSGHCVPCWTYRVSHCLEKKGMATK